jgi:hypothetical protein
MGVASERNAEAALQAVVIQSREVLRNSADITQTTFYSGKYSSSVFVHGSVQSKEEKKLELEKKAAEEAKLETKKNLEKKREDEKKNLEKKKKGAGEDNLKRKASAKKVVPEEEEEEENRSRDGGGGRGRAEKFEESDKVEANYKGKGKYYPGKIFRCRLNGTYDINYDDGDRESGVEAEMIRSRDGGGGGGGGGRGRAEKFEESDKVEAKWDCGYDGCGFAARSFDEVLSHEVNCFGNGEKWSRLTQQAKDAGMKPPPRAFGLLTPRWGRWRGQFCDVKNLVSPAENFQIGLEDARRAVKRAEREEGEKRAVVKNMHHEPLGAPYYVEFRLEKALVFYKSRLGPYCQLRTVCQATLILGSATGALLAYTGMSPYVAVVTAVTAAMTAFQEFHATDAKLERYSSQIDNLQVLELWWKALTPIEQSSPANIYNLVEVCEDLIREERQAWLSTATAQKQAPQTGTPHDPSISLPPDPTFSLSR